MGRRPTQRLFTHIADPELRKVLETETPRRLRKADIAYAIQATADDIESLYRDMSLPSAPIARRALHHLLASQAVRRGQKDIAILWIRNAWSV